MKLLIILYLVITGVTAFVLDRLFKDENDVEFIKSVDEDGWRGWLEIYFLIIILSVFWPLFLSWVCYELIAASEEQDVGQDA